MNATLSPSPITRSSVIYFKPVLKIPGLSAITTGAKLLTDTTIAKPPELIEGILHQGTKGALASGSKVGKTWLLLALALSVATGTNFLRWATTKARVLFINLEIPTAFIKERLATLIQQCELQDSGDLDFWNLRGKAANPEALIANIIKETEGKGYSLIIIDPIYKLIGKSENTAGGVGALCHLLERLAEKTGAAVVYSHHFAKGNAKKKTVMDRLSGSGVFSRDSDTIITLTPHTEPDCYTVEMVLRNFPQQPSFVVQWDYPIMVEREDLDPEDIVVEEVEDENDHGLLQCVKAAPQSNMEWQIKATALGCSRATFYRIRGKLKDKGLVNYDFETKTWRYLGGNETAETVETVEAIPGQPTLTHGLEL
jgi:hypothetical protein